MEVFEDAHPLEILRWAGEEFGDGLVVTASFGDAVLVHLVSQAIPDADVVLLDTGYLFAETAWYAEHLRREYDLNLRNAAPPRRTPSPTSGMTDTDACCQARKVEPMQRALAGKTAWVSGVRRADSPSRATTPVVHVDLLRRSPRSTPWPRGPTRTSSSTRRWNCSPSTRSPTATTRRSAAGRAPGRCRRARSPARPLGRQRQDRVRPARRHACRRSAVVAP